MQNCTEQGIKASASIFWLPPNQAMLNAAQTISNKPLAIIAMPHLSCQPESRNRGLKFNPPNEQTSVGDVISYERKVG
jgi:hypothetical protein